MVKFDSAEQYSNKNCRYSICFGSCENCSEYLSYKLSVLTKYNMTEQNFSIPQSRSKINTREQFTDLERICLD